MLIMNCSANPIYLPLLPPEYSKTQKASKMNKDDNRQDQYPQLPEMKKEEDEGKKILLHKVIEEICFWMGIRYSMKRG